MPNFFFDVRDAQGLHRDEIGEDFASFEEARVQAQVLLPDIAREELPDGELHQITCEIRNDLGKMVYRGALTFRGTRFEPTF